MRANEDGASSSRFKRLLQHKGYIAKYLILLWAILRFTLLSCTDRSAYIDPDQVVAWVGDEVITVDEFRRDYEGGFGHLKVGPDRKRSYLEFMIKERLLALEGYRLGLDRSPRVKRLEKRVLDDLLIEELIERNVRSKIKVSMEEIREAINKSKVSFKFRYWVEPTLERAQQVAQAMKERGYAAVMDDIIRQNPERRINPRHYETDYLDYLDVSPELLEAIKDLPYGEISDPVELNGKYYIFQVLDIRRQAITENEYTEKAPTFEQIVFYQKLEQELHRYVRRLLEPRKVVTKGEAFSRLAKAVQEWQRIPPEQRKDFSAAVDAATPDQPALWELKTHREDVFFTHRDGEMSIGEFVQRFDPSRIKRQPETPDFAGALDRAVALTIRDYFLAQEARRQNLHRSPRVQRELTLWRHKWVFEETADHLVGDQSVGKEEVEQYLAQLQDSKTGFAQAGARATRLRQARRVLRWRKAMTTLEEKLDSLRAVYPVRIHQAVLDTLTVTDFQKSRWATMLVFRGGTNRPAYPIVDPMWRQPANVPRSLTENLSPQPE